MIASAFPRSIRFRNRRRSFAGVVVTLILVAVALLRVYERQQRVDPFSFDSSGPYLVERAVDGDTLLLEGGTRVRLFGVDTPETKHPDKPVDPLGLQAAAFTRRHVEGRFVTLRFDRNRRDRYRRVLAYVFVDDWFLNEELILAGFSRAETRFAYSGAMKRRFLRAEEEAREAGRGMWGRQETAPTAAP